MILIKANTGRVKAIEEREKISKALTGKKLSNEHIATLRISHLGQKAWNKDRHDLPKEELAANWKGDQVGYFALHLWINKKLGKAYKCTIDPNHRSTLYVWANISGDYKRHKCNLTDGVKVPDRFNDYIYSNRSG
jgi:hypothetical protein